MNADPDAAQSLWAQLKDFLFHGKLLLDVTEDGAKGLLALAALTVLNTFRTEEQENQRIKRIREYSELIRVQRIGESLSG